MTDVEKLNQFMNLLNGSFAVLGADEEFDENQQDDVQLSLCDFEDTYIPLVGITVEPQTGVIYDINLELPQGAYTLKETEGKLRRLTEAMSEIDRCYILAYGHQPKYSWSDGEDSDQ